MANHHSDEHKTVKSAAEMSRIPALDSLRGVAILMVVASHFLPSYVLSGTADTIVGSLGRGGVLLFFFLSGYLIFGNIQRQPLPVFFMRRCFKLLPAYLVNILAIVILGAFVPDSPQYSVSAYIANILMAQDVLRTPLVNPNYWTLVIELRFYMLLALQYYFLSDRRLLAIPAAVFLANVGFWSIYGRGSVLLTYLPVFYIGIEIFRAEHDNWSRSSLARLAVIMLVIAGSMIPFTSEHWPIADALYILSLPLVFITVLRAGWNWAWLSFFGRISYSLYLFHAWVVGYALYQYLEKTSTPLWLQVPLVFGVSFLTACLSYIWIEKPGVNLGKRLERKWLRRDVPASATRRATTF
jgi:peptidoglycan/LPS O-acetylase OafA/YrhL